MFKVTITQIDKREEQEVVVRCHDINGEVVSIVEKLKNGDSILLGIKDGKTFQINVRDIFYIESVDNKTYIYLQKDVYETKLKLYELDEKVKSTKILRCSKSRILNIAKIRSVSPSVNSRLEASLINGEKVIISRQYVGTLKKILGM